MLLWDVENVTCNVYVIKLVLYMDRINPSDFDIGFNRNGVKRTNIVCPTNIRFFPSGPTRIRKRPMWKRRMDPTSIRSDPIRVLIFFTNLEYRCDMRWFYHHSWSKRKSRLCVPSVLGRNARSCCARPGRRKSAIRIHKAVSTKGNPCVNSF